MPPGWRHQRGNVNQIIKKVVALLAAIVIAVSTLAAGGAAATAAIRPAQLSATGPLYKIVYDSTIYELLSDGIGNEFPVPLTFDRWRDVYGFQTPQPANTQFVKYPWSPTIYAVTFWPGGDNSWQWTRLNFPQWQTAGYPSPRNAGWIKNSYYYAWPTAGEIFVLGEDGSHHKLTYNEWAASGYRAYETRPNEGFMKLSWTSDIVRMTNLTAGQGYAIGFGEWQNEAFPTPQTVQRIAGDQFYRNYKDSTIWYAGPGMNRPVNFNEWSAAGRPDPTVRNVPARPANVRCSDFSTWRLAQDWFEYYYDAYGDIAGLDANHNLIACESLPGHP